MFNNSDLSFPVDRGSSGAYADFRLNLNNEIRNLFQSIVWRISTLTLLDDKNMDTNKQKNSHSNQGPILIKTRRYDSPLDPQNLPEKYKKITAYITKDRGTNFETEIIVEWADSVVYRTEDVTLYDEIINKLRTKEFKLIIKGENIELTFTDRP